MPSPTPSRPSKDFLSAQLFDTLNNSNLARAKRLLEQGADAKARNSNRDTLLTTWRALSPEMLSLFIAHGAEVNARNRLGETPLMKQPMLRSPANVALLIKAGADVNMVDTSNGATPLLLAAKSGHTETVRLLLDAKADVNYHDKSGVTPLLGALSNGHADTARLLVGRGADLKARNNYDEDVLTCACATEKNPEIVDFLVAMGADVNARNESGKTALMRAAMLSKPDKLKALIRAGANVNACRKNDRGTALISAARSGYEESVRTLLEAGADPNIADSNGNTALLQALSAGRLPIVKLLLEHGADPKAVNKNGETALHCACKNSNNTVYSGGSAGNVALVDTVIDKVEDINAVDAFGNTALHFAAGHCTEKIVERLLEKGAQANISNKAGQTPLWRAAEQVDFMSKVEYEGYKADMSAATLPYMLRIARMLIHAGADLDATAKDGVSVMDLLASSGHKETEAPIREMRRIYEVHLRELYEKRRHEESLNRQEELKKRAGKFRFKP